MRCFGSRDTAFFFYCSACVSRAIGQCSHADINIRREHIRRTNRVFEPCFHSHTRGQGGSAATRTKTIKQQTAHRMGDKNTSGDASSTSLRPPCDPWGAGSHSEWRTPVYQCSGRKYTPTPVYITHIASKNSHWCPLNTHTTHKRARAYPQIAPRRDSLRSDDKLLRGVTKTGNHLCALLFCF